MELVEFLISAFTGLNINSFVIGLIAGVTCNVIAKLIIVWRFPRFAGFLSRFDRVQRQLLDIIVSTSSTQHTKESLMRYAEATGKKNAKELIGQHRIR